MFCIVCGTQCSGKTCSGACRVRLTRLNASAARADVGFLYCIVFDGALKFGSSENPNIRLRQVELASGRVDGKLHICGPLMEFRAIEKAIHRKLKSKSICGEWYSTDAFDEILIQMQSHEELDGTGIDLEIERAIIDATIAKVRKEALTLFDGRNDVFGDVFGSVDADLAAKLASEIDSIMAGNYATIVSGARAFIISELLNCDTETAARIASVYKVGVDEFRAVLMVMVNVLGLTAAVSRDDAIRILSGNVLGDDAERWLVNLIFDNNCD